MYTSVFSNVTTTICNYMFMMIFLFVMCFPSYLKIHLGKDYVYFFDSLLAQMVKSLPSMPEA